MNLLRRLIGASRSISVTVALLTLVGGFFFALIISGVSYWTEKKDDSEEMQETAQRTSDSLTYIAEVLLNKGDLDSVQRVVENTATNKGVLFIAIVDADLKALASSQRDMLGRPISDYKNDPEIPVEFRRVIGHEKPEFAHRPGQGRFEVTAPITFSTPSHPAPLSVGAVYVSFSDDPLIWNPQQNFWGHFKLTLGLTAFAMLVFYGALRKGVTNPLRRLTYDSQRLGAGEWGVQTSVTSSNEIGQLAETFNAMSVSLAEQRRALQASEERYLRIFHTSPLGLIVSDPAGSILDVNAEFTRLTGKEPSRWIGKQMADLPLLKAAQLQTEVQNLLEQGVPVKRWKVPVSLPEKESPDFFNITGFPLFDAEGKMMGTILSIEDITSEQVMEAQLIQSQKMESLGVLAGGLAHDFNNILTGVLGYASLLKMRLSLDDPNYAAAEVIEKSSMRAKGLIQQLMGFARRTPSTRSVVDVNSLISEIVLLIGKSVGQGVSVQVDLDPAAPKIKADAGQIHQALMNLGLNARDALPPGGGSITLKTKIRLLPSRLGNNATEPWVAITIQDSGSGISSVNLPRIFEPFFTTKGVGQGTGLGLSVTYGIVKEYGGELTVQSEVGKGSLFTLLFPGTSAPLPTKEKAATAAAPGKRELLLLVDDEITLRELGRTILEAKNFEVLTAESGEEALDLYRRYGAKISLVILDLRMPGIGGWKTAEELRKMAPELKILITTGYRGAEGSEQALENFPRILKPYRAQEFLGAIEKALLGEVV